MKRAYASSRPLTIVGLAGDVHNPAPAQDTIPEWYIPTQQHEFGSLNVVARTAGDPTVLEEP